MVAATLLIGVALIRVSTSDPVTDIELADSVQAISNAPFSRDPGPIEYPDEVEILASYRTIGGALADPDVDPVHAAAWARVEAVVPAEWRSRITQFSVMSEGSANIVAIVHRAALIPDAWVLSVDVDDLATPDLLEGTLIHELGHMLSLGADDFSFTSQACEGQIHDVSMDLGCARADSMIARWGNTFWTDAAPTFDTDSFVSRYATSSPHEDLAETFMGWVLQSMPTPAQNSILDAKYAFLEESPEARALRDEIARFNGLASTAEP